MRRLGRHLTYANVVATLSAFVVLCGGAAIAANQLAKNSVGKKQLKANAVTTAKIKKNAVTKAKIRNGAIDGSKVQSGALGAAEFPVGAMPYTRVAEELRLTSSFAVPVPGPEPPIRDLGASYTQPANRADIYVGAVDLSLDPSCVGREVDAFLLMDAPPNPKFGISILLNAVAVGSYDEEGNSRSTARLDLGSFSVFGTRFPTGAEKPHSFQLIIVGACDSGAGITANKVSIDVIGTQATP
jgi:hypothetical protein